MALAGTNGSGLKMIDIKKLMNRRKSIIWKIKFNASCSF